MAMVAIAPFVASSFAAVLTSLLLTISTASGVGVSVVSQVVSASPATLGDVIRLRCHARGPAGLAVRLVCPLLTSPAERCFEDCRRPVCAAATEADCRVEYPEFMAARCSLEREPLTATGKAGEAWESVILEYFFPNVSWRHVGEYTCQFMTHQSVSLVAIVEATTASTTTTEASSTRVTTRTERPVMSGIGVGSAVTSKWRGGGDDGVFIDLPSLNTRSQWEALSGLATVTEAATIPTTASDVTTHQSVGDWFRNELYGPITTGHVVIAGLAIGVLAVVVCLTVLLCCCYCRNRHRKRRLKNAWAVDPTEGARSPMLPQQQQQQRNRSVSDFNQQPDVVATAAAATASTTADSTDNLNSAQIYAELDPSASPLISGSAGTRGLLPKFGSQGGGLNSNGAAAPHASSGANGSATFFSRDQLGRHSFHSVRVQQQQQQLLHLQPYRRQPPTQQQQPATAAAAAAAPPLRTTPQQTLALIVGRQQAEILRLSQQLRDSQRQLDRLAASHTDLHRCLSTTRIRRPSSPQQSLASPASLLSSSGDFVDFSGELFNGNGSSAVIGSTDALTVDTIDEEFEADGTLRAPARAKTAPRQCNVYEHR